MHNLDPGNKIEFKDDIPNGNLFQHYRLGFGEFELLDGAILTARIDKGVEFTGQMAQQTIDLCQSLITRPGGLLIDHYNDYSYAFDALHLFADQTQLPWIVAKSILVHNLRDLRSAKYLLTLGTKEGAPNNTRIFDARREAIDWLRAEIATAIDRQTLAESSRYMI